MLTLQERKKLHDLIMHELAVKALQKDYDLLSQLKLASFYMNASDTALKNITTQLAQIKNELAHRKIRILRWEEQNEHFTQVHIATSADDMRLEYAKKAIEINVHTIIYNALPRISGK